MTYTFRNQYSLCGLAVTLISHTSEFFYTALLCLSLFLNFQSPDYPFCIQISQKVDGKVLATFNARNEHDRRKFGQDLEESIAEMDEMEHFRIESELVKQTNIKNSKNDRRDDSLKMKSLSNNRLSTMQTSDNVDSKLKIKK